MSEMVTKDKYEFMKGMVKGDRKESFLSLMSYIENETEFMKAPASTRYHLCVEGGLFEHTVSVATLMLKMKRVMAPELTDESCVIVALLHDLGKSGFYVENQPTDRQKQYGYKASIPYSISNDIVWAEHEIRTLHMIQGRFMLTEEEMYAIVYHNEPWAGQKSTFKKNKLMTLLQNADYWSCVYMES